MQVVELPEWRYLWIASGFITDHKIIVNNIGYNPAQSIIVHLSPHPISLLQLTPQLLYL